MPFARSYSVALLVLSNLRPLNIMSWENWTKYRGRLMCARTTWWRQRTRYPVTTGTLTSSRLRFKNLRIPLPKSRLSSTIWTMSSTLAPMTLTSMPSIRRRSLLRETSEIRWTAIFSTRNSQLLNLWRSLQHKHLRLRIQALIMARLRILNKDSFRILVLAAHLSWSRRRQRILPSL